MDLLHREQASSFVTLRHNLIAHRSQAGAGDAAQPGRHQIRAGRIPSDHDRKRDGESLRSAISHPLRDPNPARIPPAAHPRRPEAPGTPVPKTGFTAITLA
jgi:hypothetical protein